MNELKEITYTKEQCLYALKTSADQCRLGNLICLSPEVIVGIYNYISDTEKLYVVRNNEE